MNHETEVDKNKGTKRRATEELENDQRLAKRFNLLNLDRDGKLRSPVDSSSSATFTQQHTQNAPQNEYMEVEESKHKVYIYDLDKELAETESDEDRPIFIPDIEKHLHKIPKHILVGDDAKAMANMQMVLYNVPSSLTVPQERDNVRRAIMESRQRARNKQAIGDVLPISNEVRMGEHNAENRMDAEVSQADDDPDAMDID